MHTELVSLFCFFIFAIIIIFIIMQCLMHRVSVRKTNRRCYTELALFNVLIHDKYSHFLPDVVHCLLLSTEWLVRLHEMCSFHLQDMSELKQFSRDLADVVD